MIVLGNLATGEGDEVVETTEDRTVHCSSISDNISSGPTSHTYKYMNLKRSGSRQAWLRAADRAEARRTVRQRTRRPPLHQGSSAPALLEIILLNQCLGLSRLISMHAYSCISVFRSRKALCVY